jgi:hypothetical protein
MKEYNEWRDKVTNLFITLTYVWGVLIGIIIGAGWLSIK